MLFACSGVCSAASKNKGKRSPLRTQINKLTGLNTNILPSINGSKILMVSDLNKPVVAANSVPVTATALTTSSVSLPVRLGTLPKIDQLFKMKKLAGNYSEPVEIKFLIKDFDTTTPKVYFINAEKFPFHHDLASTLDPTVPDKSKFSQECLRAEKKYVCGFLKYIPKANPNEREYTKQRYLWYLYHNDKVDSSQIEKMHKLLSANLPFESTSNFITRIFKDEPLTSWHPQGRNQIELATEPNLAFTKPIFPHQLFKRGEERILNEGFAVGNLRVVSNPKELVSVSPTDLVILDMDHVPLELPSVAGIISRVGQHQLSHINLLSKNRGTPNVYIYGVMGNEIYKSLIGKRVKFLARSTSPVLIQQATTEEFDNFWSQKRPGKTTQLESSLEDVEIINLKTTKLSRKELIKVVGVKAANLSAMSKINGIPVPEFLFGLPMYWFDNHLQANGIREKFADKLKSPKMETDFSYRAKTLKELRKAIKNAPLSKRIGQSNDLISKLRSLLQEAYERNMPVRFRSSSNSEDLWFFNGAGLYDSKTGYLVPPAEASNKTIEKALKKVWASIWNLQAYQERDFFKIDHSSANMGILVQPSYPSDREKANGVAIAQRIPHNKKFIHFTFNIADGDRSITNPEAGDERPTALIIATISDEGEVIIQTPEEQWKAIASKSELENLARKLALVYNSELGSQLTTPFGKLDFEFKWIDENRSLLVKQVRPLISEAPTFSQFGAEKTKSGQNLSSYFNVFYTHATSPYVDYVEENGGTGKPDPYTAHIEMTFKQDIPEFDITKGEVVEFFNQPGLGTTISHPFMHHGPYDLVIDAPGHPKIQKFNVGVQGSGMTINGKQFQTGVEFKHKVVHTNWPKTIERSMKPQ